MRAVGLFLALWLAALPALAVQPDEILDDPEQEARARALSKEVRCLVCRNESIDDSSAELARDLRLLVRERIEAGDSDDEVRSFLVDRYGEFVLLKPTFSVGNAALWLAGPVTFLGGAIAAAVFLRRRRAAPEPAERPLSEEERERLARILGEEGR